MSNVCLVIPTIRENCFKDFVERWDKVGLFDHITNFIVMEDNPKRTFDVHALVPSERRAYVEHFCWEDISREFEEREWIIPRRSDTVRSFGYWKAYQTHCDYILTLDDDCYPPTEQDGLMYTGEGFIKEHLRHLNGRSKWFNTLNSVKPRGIPFYNVGRSKVILNHGLWTNVLDYDAPYQLANPIKEQFSFDNQVVPAGLYFPMCGMNVMWDASVTVLMYHLLMGKRKAMLPGVQGADQDGLVRLPFDRFGDIWCGILMKKVADYQRVLVGTGMPYIRHERASNPFTNLRKEANGIEVNEDLWLHIDGVEFQPVNGDPPDFVDCYRQLGEAMPDFTSFFPKYKEHEEYFALLGKAMVQWSELFKEKP